MLTKLEEIPTQSDNETMPATKICSNQTAEIMPPTHQNSQGPHAEGTSKTDDQS